MSEDATLLAFNTTLAPESAPFLSTTTSTSFSHTTDFLDHNVTTTLDATSIGNVNSSHNNLTSLQTTSDTTISTTTLIEPTLLPLMNNSNTFHQSSFSPGSLLPVLTSLTSTSDVFSSTVFSLPPPRSVPLLSVSSTSTQLYTSTSSSITQTTTSTSETQDTYQTITFTQYYEITNSKTTFTTGVPSITIIDAKSPTDFQTAVITTDVAFFKNALHGVLRSSSDHSRTGGIVGGVVGGVIVVAVLLLGLFLLALKRRRRKLRSPENGSKEGLHGGFGDDFSSPYEFKQPRVDDVTLCDPFADFPDSIQTPPESPQQKVPEIPARVHPFKGHSMLGSQLYQIDEDPENRVKPSRTLSKSRKKRFSAYSTDSNIDTSSSGETESFVSHSRPEKGNSKGLLREVL